jgi:probable HAF family extracellular repeat protein
MNTPKLRRIAKKYGTPGVLYVGAILTVDKLVRNKRLMLLGGGMVAAALWAMPCVTRCSNKMPTPVGIRAAAPPSAAEYGVSAADESASKYEVVELKPLDGDLFALPLALNNRGDSVGISLDENGETVKSALWDSKGAPINMGSMGHEFTEALSINDKKQAVGVSANMDDEQVFGFFWDNGKFTDVGNFGYPLSVVFAVNNRSQAAGASVTKNHRVRGFVWENGKLKDIGTPPKGNGTIPQDINDKGVVIGNAGDKDGLPIPFYYDGKMHALPKVKEYSVAIATNNDGVVVGADFSRRSDDIVPVVWQNGKGKTLPLPKNCPFGIADDINNRGEAIGVVGNDDTFFPVLWRKGNVINLAAELQGSGIILLFASSINDKGEITGVGIDEAKEEFVAVLLKPKSSEEGETTEWRETVMPPNALDAMPSFGGSGMMFGWEPMLDADVPWSMRVLLNLSLKMGKR